MNDAENTTPHPLLGTGDPQAFTVMNTSGSCPLVLIADHAGQAIPCRLHDLGLGKKELSYHIAYDIGTRAMAIELSERLNCPLVLCNYSRLVIDCNREPFDETSIPTVSDGVHIPGNQDLSSKAIKQRIEEIFTPYHQAISDTIEQVLKQNTVPAVFSIHSFTPHLMSRHEERPWQCSILWKRDPRLAQPLLELLSRDGTLLVGDNTPYSGWVDAYTIDRHGASHGLPYSAIEIRQDLLEKPEQISDWAQRLEAHLQEILDEHTPFRAKIY